MAGSQSTARTISPARHAGMEEYARLIKFRYATLRHVFSPWWLPRKKDDKYWLLAGLMCYDSRFDPTEYVEVLFRYAKPYPTVAQLHMPQFIDLYRLARGRDVPERTSIEWEKQVTLEMEFINSRISVYGPEQGIRIAASDCGKLSPTARAILARYTGNTLDWRERRWAWNALNSELAGPVYVRKFSPLMGADGMKKIIQDLESNHGFRP